MKVVKSRKLRRESNITALRSLLLKANRPGLTLLTHFPHSVVICSVWCVLCEVRNVTWSIIQINFSLQMVRFSYDSFCVSEVYTPTPDGVVLSVPVSLPQLSPIPVAERSKARVCSRSPAGIAGSNPAGDMDVCLL